MYLITRRLDAPAPVRIDWTHSEDERNPLKREKGTYYGDHAFC